MANRVNNGEDQPTRTYSDRNNSSRKTTLAGHTFRKLEQTKRMLNLAEKVTHDAQANWKQRLSSFQSSQGVVKGFFLFIVDSVKRARGWKPPSLQSSRELQGELEGLNENVHMRIYHFLDKIAAQRAKIQAYPYLSRENKRQLNHLNEMENRAANLILHPQLEHEEIKHLDYEGLFDYYEEIEGEQVRLDSLNILPNDGKVLDKIRHNRVKELEGRKKAIRKEYAKRAEKSFKILQSKASKVRKASQTRANAEKKILELNNLRSLKVVAAAPAEIEVAKT